MKDLILAFSLFAFVSCQEIVPPEVLAQNWIYRQAGILKHDGTPNFLYGDIIRVQGDSLFVQHHYLYESDAHFPLAFESDSLSYQLSFKQPNDSSLVLNILWDNSEKESHHFELLGSESSGYEKLQPINEQRISIELDSNYYDFSFFEKTKIAGSDFQFEAMLETYPETLKNCSSNRFSENDFIYKTRVRIRPQTFFPLIEIGSFADIKTKPWKRIMITGIDELGRPEFIYYQDANKGLAITGVIELVSNERTGHLSEDDIFYLLSEGDLNIDNSPAFNADSTNIRYKYQEEMDKSALKLSELKDVGFAFNADGTFDVFDQNRLLSNGTFHFSKDKSKLYLKKGDFITSYPLYSEGPDHLSFAYPFLVYTPKPLGERLISSYILDAVVHFRAFNPDAEKPIQ